MWLGRWGGGGGPSGAGGRVCRATVIDRSKLIDYSLIQIHTFGQSIPYKIK